MKKLSVMTPCYNEELNVINTYTQVKKELEKLSLEKGYDYEHVWIDNASTDNTVGLLKGLAKDDKHLKIIVNARNAGFQRSCQYGLLQCYGDAVMFFEADLQTPASLIPQLVEEWEKGYKCVAAIKSQSDENPLMYSIRHFYYKTMSRFSETPLINDFCGPGLYDQQFIEILRHIDDPNPYFRGMVAEMGIDITTVTYKQAVRTAGKSSFNFYKLFDFAMLGFVNHTKVPIRLCTFTGIFLAVISLILAIVGFVNKVLYWDTYEIGLAGLSVGLFFFSSVQLIFLGIIGEYISAIFVQVRKRPLVIEKERVNFD